MRRNGPVGKRPPAGSRQPLWASTLQSFSSRVSPRSSAATTVTGTRWAPFQRSLAGVPGVSGGGHSPCGGGAKSTPRCHGKQELKRTAGAAYGLAVALSHSSSQPSCSKARHTAEYSASLCRTAAVCSIAPWSGPMRQGVMGRRRMSRAGFMRLRSELTQLLGEICRHDAGLQCGRAGRIQNGGLRRARRVVGAGAPGGSPPLELDPAGAARAASAESVVLEQPQALGELGDEFPIFRTKNVEHQADAEFRAGRHALESAGAGLAGEAVDGVLALYLGQIACQILPQRFGDAVDFEQRVVDRETRRRGGGRIDGLSGDALDAARIAAKQQADFRSEEHTSEL